MIKFQTPSMKNKQLLLGSFLILYSHFVKAQEYTLGVKGGINFNSIGELYHIGTANGGGIGVIPIEDTYYKADKNLGSQFGVFGMIAFKYFYIRPELNSTSLKNTYPLSQKKSEWTSSTVDIPILFGYKIYNPLSIYIGPVFSHIKDMKLEGVQSPIIYKTSAINLSTGILVNFRRFGLDFRYNYGLNKVQEQRVDIIRSIYGTNVAKLLQYNPSQIIISLHFNLININGYEHRKKVKKGWRPNCGK